MENPNSNILELGEPWAHFYPADASNAPFPQGSIYHFMREQNRGYEGQPALRCGDLQLTFSALFEQIERAAAGFQSLGVGAGDVVSIISLSTPETICVYYALNAIGAVSHWLDLKASPQELRMHMEEVHATLVVVLDLCFEKIAHALEGKTILLLPFRSNVRRDKPILDCLEWDTFLERGEDWCTGPDLENQTAVIVYTGGTTGIPKGVQLSNEAINALVHQYRYSIPHCKRGQTAMALLPPFAAYGLCASIHVPLSLGMMTVLIPLFRPQDFGRCLLRYRPNHVNGTTSFWQALMECEEVQGADLSFLRSPGTGGDGMTAELEKQINTFLQERQAGGRLIKGYGMTEVCATACLCTEKCNELGSVGIPMLGNAVQIIDPRTSEVLEHGKIGEILIASRASMLGYLSSDEETIAQKDTNGRVWVYTKDLGYLSKEGALYVVGRLKRTLIKDGFKIYPAVVEGVIAKHPAVSMCAVMEKENAGESIAYVVLKQGERDRAEILQKELKAWCREHLNRYQIPQEIEMRDTLPLTTVGKLDLRALR